GSGPQPQNLKKPETDDVAAAITAVLTGDYDHVRSLYPRVLSLLGDLSRSLICAAPDCVLIGADFGAIESRVLAWVADEQWKLEAYRRYDARRDSGDEPYCVLASRMLHLPEGSVKPGSRERAFGKTGAWRAAIKEARTQSKSLRPAYSARKSGSKSRPNGVLPIAPSANSGTRSIVPPGLPYRSAVA